MAENCPLCAEPGAQAEDVLPFGHNVSQWTCASCGCFIADDRHLRALQPPIDSKIRALIHECALQLGTPVLFLGDKFPPPIPGAVPFQLDSAADRFPSAVSDRLDRALQNLARQSPGLGDLIGLQRSKSFPILFACKPNESDFVVRALDDAGWLANVAITSSGFHFEISPAGWNRIAELQTGRTRSPKNPAFVAMWFGSNEEEESPAFMRSLYDGQILPAVLRAGYHAERVDIVEHNDFIMDKVLGMIRVAPFVVADFTGNRGGVYFEAAFARGLGIPVIHTCRAGKHFDNSHFDIKQINTIAWDSPDSLSVKLYHRIVGTLGQGPYGPPREET